MEDVPRCAVVIPTHERPATLRALLRSLSELAATFLDEVVVVDDSARPTVRREEFPLLDLRVVRLDERSFISHARNVGLGYVRSEFVFVVDDDNVCDPATVAHPLAHFGTDRRAAALMPGVVYHRRPDLVWVYAVPFRPDRWGFELVGRNRTRDPELENRLLPTDALPNAAVFRSDALRAVAGYDERWLPVNSSADLCQRLKGAGWAVWADTFARTRHDVELPGQPAFWAAHSGDPPRQYYEVHDWYVLQRRVHPHERAFVVRSLLHSAPFLATSILGSFLRSDVPSLPLALSLGRGVVGGLRDASGPPGYARYGPSG